MQLILVLSYKQWLRSVFAVIRVQCLCWEVGGKMALLGINLVLARRVCSPVICAKSCLPCAVLTVGLLHQIIFTVLLSTNTLLYQLL